MIDIYVVSHAIKLFLLIDIDIRTRPFILMMADYFCKTSDGQYPPAEVAVMKFSFENAILKQYHTFVDPGM